MDTKLTSSELLCLFAEAQDDYRHHRRDIALEKLDSLLQQASILDSRTLEYMNHIRNVWERVLDVKYSPPAYFNEADVYPLTEKAGDLQNSGQKQQALSYAWMYLQYCAAGTTSFLVAIEEIIDISLSMGNTSMARAAAEMFLSHSNLMLQIAHNNIHGLSKNQADDANDWLYYNSSEELSLPWPAALEAISQDPADCWERILRRELEQTLNRHDYEQHRAKIIEALRLYYENSGNISSLNFLVAYELIE